jgi:hypothetical protein
MRRLLRFVLWATACLTAASAAESPRRETSLDHGWRSVALDYDPGKSDDFARPGLDVAAWSRVDVPHNWDDYAGLRRLVHGNRHGTAWYRREFTVDAAERGRRVYLFFEGVGSYATVWVNGRPAGKHAGGRTTFTLDVTDLVSFGGANLLAVRADHPAGITDLPWVCGGCSEAPGFSEGSQPMGVFRPVTLVTTEQVRVKPFGVHVWNDADATEARATVRFTAAIANHGASRDLVVDSRVLDPSGREVAVLSAESRVAVGEHTSAGALVLPKVSVWSLTSPSLYTLETTILEGGRVLDKVKTSFGVRTLRWPDPAAPESAPFRLNGAPVFINGTCEYEHQLGASHAFSAEQILARVRQIRAAGFNAFRDAHQPHNLRYQDHWDREGLLWWTQFAAQIWFDTPEFRATFKQLLREWVIERRNSPSLVLWGLANESKLPADFAAECVAIIRELDPTTSSQRLVTTCNSGQGTDWNVPQNWTGTYGGDPATYADDLRRQRLVGEYGAWRSLGLHSEGGFIMDGIRGESRHDALMAQKIRLAESVRAEVPGHFHWLFATHENPGRVIGARGQQGSDGWAPLDRLGPANNKGLLTLWGEPTDAFFLYRGSYAPKTDPMVYIVSHNWPDRWESPGVKRGLEVYSNCDEVELFNDVGDRSLGVRRNGGPGVPFRWDEVEIATNLLYAEGRVAGRTVARDAMVLDHLPEAPGRRKLNGPDAVSTAGEPGWNYLYRLNCGGPDYTDTRGQTWFADRDLAPGDSWGARSWASDHAGLPPRFGSQRELHEPVRGTADEALFKTFRFGRHRLSFEFAVPDGDYRVELYFAEPWYGRGGGDATGWRLFDVAVNGETLLRDVDLWREAGYATAVKKIVTARARDGRLVIGFPRVASYQAVIGAVAIATLDPAARAPVPQTATPIRETAPLEIATDGAAPTGQVYAAEAAKRTGPALSWNIVFGLGGSHDFTLRYANPGESADAEFRVNAADGTVMDLRVVRFRPTSTGDAATAELRIPGVGMNAGDYTVTVIPPESSRVRIEALRAD